MKYIILLLSIINIQACSQGVTRTNPFENEVLTSKSDDHKRIKGTKLFAIIPDEYEYIQELSRYQISDQQFIQFQTIPNNSWNEYKTRLNKESFGNGLIIFESIKFNGYDGLFVEGVDPNSNKNDIVLAFGDKDFISLIICKTSKQNFEAREELIKILKSIYYDRNFGLNEFELANFEFDKTLSNFSLAFAGNNMFMFAKNGKEDAENPFASSMLFQTLPHMSNEKLMTYFTDMIERHKLKNITLKNENIKETQIGNYKVIQLESEIEFESRKGILNQAILSDEKNSIMFLGSGYDDIIQLKSVFNRTIETIKLK